ncbi:hypothetical protein FRC01_002327 [Tulasnella sp. 417]|nr:hypothetical protein FRC01_002327 [Tulasnella sp. 417]
MYQEWLSRLKDAPFSVWIDWQAFGASSIKHAKAIMRLIMPHISRLRILRTGYIPTKVIRLIFDRLSDANMPLLQKLIVRRLRSPDDDLPEPSRRKIRFKPFLRAHVPALKELHLDGLPHDYLAARIRETLQVFTTSPRINFIGAQECAKLVQEVLSRFPGLRVFGFFHPTSRPFGYRELEHTQLFQTPPLPPVRHSSLQKFVIQAGGAIIDIIICSLVLTHVRYFLDEFQQELALGIGCLQYLELGPFPSLICLRLRGSWNMSGEQLNRNRDPRNSRNLAHLMSTLQLLPQLQSLTFESVDFEHNLYLSKCLGAAKCCPVLQWLSLLQCVGYKLQELRVIVEARRGLKNVEPLGQITVYEWPARSSITPEEQEIRDWLGEAVEFRAATTIYDGREGQNYLRIVEGIGRQHQF